MINKAFIFLIINVFLFCGCAATKRPAITPIDKGIVDDKKTTVKDRTIVDKEILVNNKTIINDEAILLSGNDVLKIVNSHYTLNNNIILRDNAKLIIRNSFFKHHLDYSCQYNLKAYDNASVIIEDSEIQGSTWLYWNFYGNSSLLLKSVDNSFFPWHCFLGSARAKVDLVDNFNATMSAYVEFDIADTDKTFIEIVYPPGSKVDEAFPEIITDYTFPNEGENGINSRLTIKNSQAGSWGITVKPDSDISIRDTHSLVVTFSISKPYKNITAELNDLKAKLYEDHTWHIPGNNTLLHLTNTKTRKWSPIVSENNTLIVRNSDIADNAYSYDNARIYYENCTISLLRANDRVSMTIKDSVVKGDVVATEDSTIELINTKVNGRIIEKDNGKVIIR